MRRLTSWIRKALTRKIQLKRRVIEVEPSERFVRGMELVITMLLSLTAMEIAHMIFLGSWNSEVFSAITGLIGTIIGFLVKSKG